MHIELEDRNGLCVLHLKGRFTTGSNAEYLRTREELAAAGKRRVFAECGDLAYLDSTGLTFMVRLYKDLTSAHGSFALVNVPPRVREILTVTRLDGVIPMFDSWQAALTALRN